MGDNHQFELNIDETVRRYADMVYRLALLNMKNHSDAEDVFQEVFLKLFRYQENIQSEEHLKAWLIRVTINQCKSVAVSAWSRHNVPLDMSGFAEESKGKKEYTEVYDIVKSLPDKYRQVIHLYYYEELSIKEIAEILGIKEATIKTRLARARKLLSRKLKGVQFDERI